MDVVTAAQRMTAEEFLALEPRERWRELIDGEIVVNEPSWIHNRRHSRICFASNRGSAADRLGARSGCPWT